MSADEQTLSTLLEKPDTAAAIQAQVVALRGQVDAEVDVLGNLRLGGREQAAEIESARAHDLRARGVSSDAYIESLAKQKPGPELLGSENDLDPLLQAQALALAVKIVEAGRVPESVSNPAFARCRSGRAHVPARREDVPQPKGLFSSAIRTISRLR